MPQASSSYTRQINRSWLESTSKSYYPVLNLICLMWAHSFPRTRYYCLNLEITWCEVGWKIKEASTDLAVFMLNLALHLHPPVKPCIKNICLSRKASSDCWVTVAVCSADLWNPPVTQIHWIIFMFSLVFTVRISSRKLAVTDILLCVL